MKLKGKIFDVATKEPLFGANVFVSDKDGKLLTPTKGTSSDPDGKYLLDGINTSGHITVSSVGYETMTYPILANTNAISAGMNFGLKQKSNELAEFEVIATKEEKEEPNLYVAKKARNYTPYIIGGAILAVIIIGFITYKSLKK